MPRNSAGTWAPSESAMKNSMMLGGTITPSVPAAATIPPAADGR